jgi:hypothetical protein
MLRSIDGRSLLIGGLLVAVAVCVMGGAPVMSPEFHGRFAMTGYDTAYGGASIYILDTATGQLWSQSHTNTETFYAPKLEGYAPEEEPIDPNWPQP